MVGGNLGHRGMRTVYAKKGRFLADGRFNNGFETLGDSPREVGNPIPAELVPQPYQHEDFFLVLHLAGIATLKFEIDVFGFSIA